MLAYLTFATVAAAADLAGAVLVVTAHRKGQAPLRYFVAAGAGFMLAAAFVRMLPESANIPHAFLFVLIGYFGIHLFEHTVAPHFHFGEEVHPEALLDPAAGWLALLGLGVHTLFDGVAIAAGFMIGPALGALLSMAVFLHKVPEGFTIASIMLAGGHSRAGSARAARSQPQPPRLAGAVGLRARDARATRPPDPRARPAPRHARRVPSVERRRPVGRLATVGGGRGLRRRHPQPRRVHSLLDRAAGRRRVHQAPGRRSSPLQRARARRVSPPLGDRRRRARPDLGLRPAELLARARRARGARARASACARPSVNRRLPAAV